jgi:hypothetical protein
MAIVNYIQASFAAGVLTPKLAGRTDLSKYKTGLASLHNFLVSPYGCVFRRPGTRFVEPTISTSNISRLVRFEYSNEQAYQIEFSAGKIRFYKDQGQILRSRGITNGTFASGISGWTSNNAGTGTISWDAGNQRLSLNGGGGANYARAYQAVANIGLGTFTITMDVVTSTITYRVGTSVGGSSLATGTLTAGTGKTFNFTVTANSTVYIEFECASTAGIDNIVLNTGNIYEIDIPYTNSEINDLRFAQSFDTLYITHRSYVPRQLQRLGHDNWVLSTVLFIEPPYLDENTSDTTITPSATTGSVTVTASSAIFASTDVGRAIRYKSGPDRSDVTNYTGTGTQTYFDIPFYPQGPSDLVVSFIESSGARTAKTYTSGAPGAGQFTITNGQIRTGDTASSSQRVEISPAYAGSGEWGWMKITAYTSSTQVTALVQKDLAGTNASTEWRLGAWSETTGYPRVVVFHEQRLYFANTENQPQTFWGSAIADYTNFQPDNVLYKGAIDNDTSVSFTLAANNSQAINWLASKGALIIGTSNAVFSAKGSSGSITASNVSVKKEADIPTAFTQVAETYNEIIFVESLGQRVYSVFYSFQLDGYDVQELTLLSDHLGKISPILEITYQPTSKILWARREDGTLLSCTYIRNQEVIGWATHSIGGTDSDVQSISVIPGATYSELWMVVNRSGMPSGFSRTIEFMTQEFDNEEKEDAIFLDCSLTYSGTSSTSISNLDHVASAEVSVLVNGSVHPNVTVSSGGVATLSIGATKATFGFGYESYLETMSIEAGSKIGSAQGSISRISEVSIRFFETIGAKVGFDSNSIDIIQFRESNDLMNTSPDLYSGFKIIKFNSGFNPEYKVYLKQDQPLPITVLNIVFKAQISDAQ